jgi:nucleoside-diphosphate-sugar epimerase
MRVFVTGATGFIGSAVVAELTKAGHQVLGLARSDAAAVWLARAGAEVHRGSLDDPDSLARGAAEADGVIHLAYNHDFSQIPAAAATDRRAIEAIGAALAGSGRPFVVACGMMFSTPGRPGTEEDAADPNGRHPRIPNEGLALAWASRGVRASVVRLAPSVHGDGDHGLVPILIDIARNKGGSAYVGDGSNRWSAVHRLDAASLFRLALERAPAGTRLHGAGEEGVPIRDVATVIGRRLNLPVVSRTPEEAAEHFGWMAHFIGADMPASSAYTRERFGWRPTQVRLIADLENGTYFKQD